MDGQSIIALALYIIGVGLFVLQQSDLEGHVHLRSLFAAVIWPVASIVLLLQRAAGD